MSIWLRKYNVYTYILIIFVQITADILYTYTQGYLKHEKVVIELFSGILFQILLLNHGTIDCEPNWMHIAYVNNRLSSVKFKILKCRD